MLRVVVADDQALVRAGFRMILQAQPDIEVIGEAEDGAQAIAITGELDPDVVLMDIRMPGIDGLEATQRLLQADQPRPHVLMLTTFDTDEYVYRALRAGASGFLLKTAPPARLIEAVRTIAAGEALLAPTVTRRLIESFVRRPPPGSADPPELAALTQREVQVLTMAARGMSNLEIAQSLFLSEATVKSHINRIFAKLSIRDRVQAVVLAYETGLVTPGGNPAVHKN
ncbi:MAG: response regulator transcription factor [Actinobacteria bacterium]|nr:response regulator transcription factor [Actinomycetota bacterium]